MSGKAVAASTIGASISLLLCCVAFALYMYVTNQGAVKGKKKKGAKGPPPPCQPKSKECAYTQRMFLDGKWQCPPGYEENWCNWDKDGPENGKLQCRACGTANPNIHYLMPNPNCPAGFVPCNNAPFNFGDLKRKPDGEFYYEPGWGVDAPEFNWNRDGYEPAGGSITLNIGKFGGTDAHPEVFAKGCCAWGNSTDDPERDKANKAIKIASFAVSGAIDVAAAIAAPFTGGLSTAATLALHGATTAASAGAQSAGFIRAKCGGPTELYKKTGRNYIFKAPYKDGPRVRGYKGLWYTANDGCPLKWLQYVPNSSQ